MYFNEPQWAQGQGGALQPNVIQQQQQPQGGGFLSTLSGLASILGGFGVGGPMMSGAANALNILDGGGGGQANPQTAQNAQVINEQTDPNATKPKEETPKENKEPETPEINTEPINNISPLAQLLGLLGLGLQPQMMQQPNQQPPMTQQPNQQPPMMGR